MDQDSQYAPDSVDFLKERGQAEFKVAEMHEFLVGGKERVELKKLAYRMIERDPELSFGTTGHPFDLTRAELRAKTMAQIRRWVETRQQIKSEAFNEALAYAMCELSESFSMRVLVSESLFPRNIRMFGTEEQRKTWLPLIQRWEVIGCLAMTELGHSSNLRGLETRAEYDRETDSFIVNSPTDLATKWWIGMAGQTATHAVVLSKLILDDSEYGLHWFIIPLRDPKNGRLLPGVTCGDVGAKAGRDGLDNGWMQFTHVRIPRKNMLSRWARVQPDGTFAIGIETGDQPDPKAVASISYAGLIPERLEITRGVPIAIGQALTIAIRYACLRRQGAEGNPQIIDYPYIQQLLLPHLAINYAVLTSHEAVWRVWRRMENNLENEVALLADIHALSSGIKATVTWRGADALENCRRSMGGHAYSRYNAIADAIGDFGVMTTGGGDNIVLVQQTTKYLLKSYRSALNKEPLIEGSNVWYMHEYLHGNRRKTSVGDRYDVLGMFGCLIHLTMTKLKLLSERLRDQRQKNAWNENIDLVSSTAQLHTYIFLVRSILAACGALPGPKEDRAPQSLHGVLLKLSALFLLDLLTQFGLDLVSECKYPAEGIIQIRMYMREVCGLVRPQALSLVDALGFPDFVLKAPLAGKSGNGYKKYFETVRNAPRCIAVPDYYEQSIKPLVKPMRSSL